ncbi:MAG: hypothetical protein FWB91_09460 [Defluviitaleaceae bacterium]|nr:hypothetical protein [Defluviitaleaceae bacterium]
MRFPLASKFTISLIAFIFAALLLLLVFFITRPREDVPSPGPAPAPTRGAWDGNVFISEYLGLEMALPDSAWRALNDGEIGRLQSAAGIVTDFYLHNEKTAASIELTFKRMPRDAGEYSLREHLEHCGEIEKTQAAELGLESSFEIIGTTEIAGTLWLTKRAEFAVPGFPPVVTFHLTSREGDYIRCFKFVVDDDDEFLEILLWFSRFE